MGLQNKMNQEVKPRPIFFFSDETTPIKREASASLRQILITYNILFEETKIGVDVLGADFETPNVMIQGRLLKGDKLLGYLDYLTNRGSK